MLKKILIAVPVVALAAGGGAWWYANQQAKTIVDERLADMVASGGYDEATYEELHIGLNGGITMKNLNIVQGPLAYTLQDITVTEFDYTSEFPRTMDVTIDGLKVAVEDNADPEIAAFAATLRQLGLDEDVPLHINYKLLYDPDNAHQTDSKMHMTVTDSFTIDATSVTRGVPMTAFAELDNADPVVAQQQMMALLESAEFPSMQMTLQDHGFLDSMITMSAEQNGVSPEDFRNLLVSQVTNMYLFLPPTAQNLAMATGAELAEFLEGGKTLSVSLTPDYGGKVQTLQAEIMGAVFTGDYDKISQLLHLEITTQ